MASEPSRSVAPRVGRGSQPAVNQPSIALALGGGGARGLAHILMLEAFDELGIRPKVIAGTSIGAIFGAAYASGLRGAAIRAHTVELLTARLELMRDLIQARVRKPPRLRDFFAPRSAILAPDSVLDLIFPAGVARDFDALEIPLKIVASDFYGQEPVIFTSGPLRRAVAASMALPVIFEPVVVDGRALIDGGLTNPLPFDLLFDEADITVAIDVTGAPVPRPDRDHPSATEALFASSFIFERTIIREKLKVRPPDIYIDAGTSRFQILDLLKVKQILKAAEPAKERLKAQLRRVLGAETLCEIAPSHSPQELAEEPQLRRQLLKRLTPKIRNRRR